MVLQNSSNPKFAAKIQQCSKLLGFGCWCGVNYDRAEYLAEDGSLRTISFTTGIDSLLYQSDLGVNQV